MTETSSAIEEVKAQLKRGPTYCIEVPSRPGHGDEIAKALVKLVLHNLHDDPDFVFRVNGIVMKDSGITDDGATTLGEALPHLRHLYGLEIYHANMGPAGARAIANGAYLSPRLNIFRFSDHDNESIGPEVIKAFAYRPPPRLDYLELRKTNIGDEGMPDVATLLQNSETLYILDLSMNRITDTGPISDALSVHSRLSKLALYENGITDSGIRGLAKALFHNTHLKGISLWGNRLTDNGDQSAASCLMTALSHNRTVESLKIEHNDDMSDETIAKIQEFASNCQERRRRMAERFSLLLLKLEFSDQHQLSVLPSVLNDAGLPPPSKRQRTSEP